MTPRILGIGTAIPAECVSQEDAAAMALRIRPPAPEAARLVPVLYRRSGIRQRGSVLLSARDGGACPEQAFFPPAQSDDDAGPGTGARLDRYAFDAPALAEAAARAAIAEAGATAAAGSISHLVTASCTGLGAPGVDAALIQRLGLARRVERTNVGFMGCHAAINALRVARAIVAADASARVLVCAVELCSLHFHYTGDPEQMVANALFADGAAAALVGTGEPGAGAPAGGSPGRALEIAATGSLLVPGSADAMTWRIGDHGFKMTLSARVPDLLRAHLRAWLAEWLGECGMTIADVGSWAVHPGGPRVLSTVAECLGLDEPALDVSRAVLAEHGNMSSPTVLFIIDRLRRAEAKRPIVAMAFGPGLTAEATMLV